MKIENLNQLLEHNLQDLYSAEKQIIEVLPKMIAKATHKELKNAFEKHLTETEKQRDRLEKACKMLGAEHEGEKCLAMQGLVKEAEHFLKEDMTPEVCDAGMIGLAQKIEHYEIAGYGTVVTWCRELGHDDVCALLEQTLAEEKLTDETLTQIAESTVNMDAEGPLKENSY